MPNKPQNLYEYLLFIKPHIHLYIGSKSLNDLRTYISGFNAAGWVYNKTNTLEDLTEFHDFVAGKYKLISSGDGWPKMILDHCSGNEASALEAFYILLEEFRNKCNSEGK